MAKPRRLIRLLTLVSPLLLIAGSAFASFPLNEAFDDVTAPTLPPLWTNVHVGDGDGWVTTSGDITSLPNVAFIADTSLGSDGSLVSPAFNVVANGRVTFRHKHILELENNDQLQARDAAVLEISIAGGAFQDILAAGGSFVRGGYDNVVSACCFSLLAGRPAWSGTDPNYATVVVNLPPAANGHAVKLRWRVVTDFSGGDENGGYWLDDIHVQADGTTATFPPLETFDRLVANELPPNWINDPTRGPGIGWTTVAGDDGTPGVAFTGDTATVSDQLLETPAFDVIANGRVSFIHWVDLETGNGGLAFDGVVLEIAYGNDPFVDISDAGAIFVTGAYDHVVSTLYNNPLSGRGAWSGTSAGYQPVVIDLPAAANGRSVRLRWRIGTDYSVGRTGYELDTIQVDVNGPRTFPPAETFDEVTAPALPTGWTNTHAGAGAGWITRADTGSSAPNAAFTDDPPTVTDKSLTTPAFMVGANEQLSFRHKVDMDAVSPPSQVGYDGVVLEVSISGGPFQDIVAAGGNFAAGSYDHIVPSVSTSTRSLDAMSGVDTAPATATSSSTCLWQASIPPSPCAGAWAPTH